MSLKARRCAVLDIETAPDPHAVVLSRRSRSAARGSPVFGVVAASMLTFVERADGTLGRYELTTWHESEYTERDILANVDATLAGVADDGGILGTFNGVGHDLPTLRMRQLRWWLCEGDAVSRIQSGEGEHVDAMLELSGGGDARWPSLSDACASVGFSLKGPNLVGRASSLPYETEKCETDVIGTAILLHYVLAGRRKSAEPLRRGLPALGAFVRSVVGTRPHLGRFAASRLLGKDATAWGDERDAS